MKIPALLLAPVVVVSFFGVILAANLWELPTQRSQIAEASTKTTEIHVIVDGLFCRGKSNFLVNMLSKAPGLVSVDTYVQEQRAVIVFDPTKISVNEIEQIIETPFRLTDGRIVQPFSVREVRK
jgi:hypothetical protein